MAAADQCLPLVVSGPPRSGTTLFSALLDGHPDINWFIDEAFFFEHLHVLGQDNFQRFVEASMLGTEHLVDGLRDRSLMPPTHAPASDFPSLQYSWSESRFREVLALRRVRSVPELWQLLRDAYLAGFGYAPRRYVSIKAADYGRSVFGALENFIEARGIVVVREPVAALNSLKAYRQKRNAKLLTWPTLVQAIVDMNRIAEMVDRLDTKRLRVVRYEDFADDADETMRKLCDWLDLPFSPVVLKPTMMGQSWSNNSSFAKGESGKAELPRERDTLLSEAERDYALRALMPFRKRFGYV